MKIHLAVTEQRPDYNWTGTLCGMQSSKSEDGANAEVEEDKVNCKRCKSIMADKAHWRHRRYIAKQP